MHRGWYTVPMHFTDADIVHLGKLVRLSQTLAQRQMYAEQLSRVLDYLDQINQSDVPAVEGQRRSPVTPYDVREDIAMPADAVRLVAQAPTRDGSFVVSPPTT